MMVLSGGDIPDDPAEEFQSEFGCAEEEVKTKKRTENSSGHCNKEIDRVLETAIKTKDAKQRYELYRKAIQAFHDDVVDIPLAYVPRYFVFQQKVQGFETDADGRFNMKDRMRGWSDELDEFPPMPVKDGAIFQNVDEGEQVNLLKFPAPLWHHDDGGRYIGTGSVAIMRERSGDWVNLGTYRVMIHDEKSAGIFIAPGHHGRIIMDSYWKAGEPCPIAISAGHHPVFLFAGSFSLPPRVPEYNYVGSVLHERIPVVAGRLTGLPLPVFSEIVLEGFLFPNELKSEGKFGEWPGYYVSDARPEPVIQVKAVYYRNDPIILGAWSIRIGL